MATNKFCTRCGAKLELGLKFCTECGQPLDDAVSPPESVVAKSNHSVAEAAKSEGDYAASPKALTAKRSPPSPQAPFFTPDVTRPKETYIAAPSAKASIESARKQNQPSPVGFEAPRTNDLGGKRNYLLIGLVASVILGAAGYFLTEKSSPTATPAGKSAKSQPVASPSLDTSKAPTAKESDPAAALKVPEAGEVLKLVIAVVDAAKTKDESSVQKSLDTIRQLPVPRRGDRAIARAANTAGLAKLQVNELGDAISSFRDGIAADPSDVEIVNNLGYALSLAGKESDAIENFARAISLAPDRSSAWANLAVSWAKSGQMERGVAAYLLAYRFSKNQERTKSFLAKQSEEATDVRERELVQQVLKAIDQP
jgi:Flp pilus assembly protein TadD